MFHNDEIDKIRYVINSLFDYYEKDKDNILSEVVRIQKQAVEQALYDFSYSEQHENIYFSLGLRNDNELQYIAFVVAVDYIEISESISIYNGVNIEPSDSNLWKYTMRNTGENEGSLLLDYDNVIEMINQGAWLDFKSPERLNTNMLCEKTAYKRDIRFLEKLIFSYERLMSNLAEPIEKRIIWKIKRQFQSYDRKSEMMLTSDDCSLINYWEEICVQVQGEESVCYDSYIDEIERHIGFFLEKCTVDEKIILWTQTQDYEDKVSYKEYTEDTLNLLKSDFNEASICIYLRESVLAEAAEYHNKRIDDFLFRYDY